MKYRDKITGDIVEMEDDGILEDRGYELVVYDHLNDEDESNEEN